MQEGNLATNGLDLDQDTISDANEIDRDVARNIDTDEDNQNPDDDDESTDSGDRKSRSSDDSGPSLPFP
jgi:hypothetical protein